MTIDQLEKETNNLVRIEKMLPENGHKRSTHIIFYSRTDDNRTAHTICMESQVLSTFMHLLEQGVTHLTAREFGNTMLHYDSR